MLIQYVGIQQGASYVNNPVPQQLTPHQKYTPSLSS